MKKTRIGRPLVLTMGVFAIAFALDIFFFAQQIFALTRRAVIDGTMDALPAAMRELLLQSALSLLALVAALMAVTYLVLRYAKRQSDIAQKKSEAQLDAAREELLSEQTKLKKAYADLRTAAFVDPASGFLTQAALTGWLDANYPRFVQLTSEELLGGGQTAAFALIYPDDMPVIRKLNGRETAEQFIVLLGQFIDGHTRKSDLVARWEGDALMLVLSAISLKDALMRCETLRSAVAEQFFGTMPPCHTTLSIGVSLVLGGDQNWHSTMTRTQRALKRAKDGGGDAICHDVLR